MKFRQVTVIPLIRAFSVYLILKLQCTSLIEGWTLFQSKGIIQIKLEHFVSFSFQITRNTSIIIFSVSLFMYVFHINMKFVTVRIWLDF